MCFSLFWLHPVGTLETWLPFHCDSSQWDNAATLFPLNPKQSNTETLCAVSSSSSFLPSTKQHGEGNILLTVEAKTLSSPQKPSSWPSDVHMLDFIFYFFK